MLAHGVEEVAHHARRCKAADRHVLQQVQAAEDAVPLRDVPPKSVAAALLAAQYGVVGDEPGADVLEAHRHFGNRYAVLLGQLVQHHRRRYAFHQRAPVAPFQQVQGQQREHFQRADEPPRFVHQPDAVGVAVQSQASRCAFVRHTTAKLGQVMGDGFRLGHTGKGRVKFGPQLFYRGGPADQKAANIAGPGPVHRVHQHVQAGLADGIQVHQAGDGLTVRRNRVNVLHQAGGASVVQGQHFRLAGGFNAQLQGVGDSLAGAAPLGRLELEPAPGRRVVAGRDDHTAGCGLLHHMVAHYWCRRRFPAQIHANAVA